MVGFRWARLSNRNRHCAMIAFATLRNGKRDTINSRIVADLKITSRQFEALLRVLHALSDS